MHIRTKRSYLELLAALGKAFVLKRVPAVSIE
jgi:hypothetical protein